jgi:hypothetical protein
MVPRREVFGNVGQAVVVRFRIIMLVDDFASYATDIGRASCMGDVIVDS